MKHALIFSSISDASAFAQLMGKNFSRHTSRGHQFVYDTVTLARAALGKAHSVLCVGTVRLGRATQVEPDADLKEALASWGVTTDEHGVAVFPFDKRPTE